MDSGLDLFIKSYCVISEGEYVKLSRFKECYKGFCHDNNLSLEDLNEENLGKYNIEIITMNYDKWLSNVRVDI